MIDTIGDLIIRLKNASMVKKATVSIPFSLLKQSVVEKLKAAGYVHSYEKKGKKIGKKTLEVTLKYHTSGAPAITNVKRISRPGCRSYRGVRDIKPVRYGYGSMILSTPKGILTDKEARKEGVGGEALFQIW